MTSNFSIQSNHLSRIDHTVSSLNESILNAKSIFSDLTKDLDTIRDVSSTTKTRLDRVEQKCCGIERDLNGLDKVVQEKFSKVQQWIDDLSPQIDTPVPREIVDSIQEVINDSAPGLAVESMRSEVRELRRTIQGERHVTEGLRNLVVSLAEQVERTPSTPVPAPLLNPDTICSDGTSREREIIRKGIERLEKQIEQLIKVDISSDLLDISLIKKCKTVDVPAIHSAIGHIQKSLQKYVNFPGMDEDYCDVINDLLDLAESWCRRIEELYNKAEVHSINSSLGGCCGCWNIFG